MVSTERDLAGIVRRSTWFLGVDQEGSVRRSACREVGGAVRAGFDDVVGPWDHGSKTAAIRSAPPRERGRHPSWQPRRRVRISNGQPSQKKNSRFQNSTKFQISRGPYVFSITLPPPIARRRTPLPAGGVIARSALDESRQQHPPRWRLFWMAQPPRRDCFAPEFSSLLAGFEDQVGGFGGERDCAAQRTLRSNSEKRSIFMSVDLFSPGALSSTVVRTAGNRPNPPWDGRLHGRSKTYEGFSAGRAGHMVPICRLRPLLGFVPVVDGPGPPRGSRFECRRDGRLPAGHRFVLLDAQASAREGKLLDGRSRPADGYFIRCRVQQTDCPFFAGIDTGGNDFFGLEAAPSRSEAGTPVLTIGGEKPPYHDSARRGSDRRLRPLQRYGP